MSSKPRLYYREEEIYEEWGGARVFVNRELVGFKRGLMEFTELADLALAAHAEGHRTLALADGTLILWKLGGQAPRLPRRAPRGHPSGDGRVARGAGAGSWVH